MVPTVFDETELLHDPHGGVWVGIRITGDEPPERATIIKRAVEGIGSEILTAEKHPVATWPATHDPTLVEFLATAFEQWHRSNYPKDPGQDLVVPYVFAGVTGVDYRKPSPSIGARAGEFAMDTMTLIGGGTWEAVEGAVASALSAADLVAAGTRAAYALTRPPGHHAGRAYFGGSCYLNNAALAAQRLIDRGVTDVTVIDVDAHHGNGTQDIFYERQDVGYVSVHVDPGQGWFPHFVGYADEVGADRGLGANLNLPLAPGSDDDSWLAAVAAACEFGAERAAVVVSLGVDAALDDPESPLEVSAAGYRRAGEMIGALGKPTVLVQEGGYHLPTLGGLVAGFLEGFQHGDKT